MSYTSTHTATYTLADVKNVFEQVAADFAMIVRTTGLWSTEYAEETISDVMLFAEAGYVSRVDIVMSTSDGVTVRASRYDVSETAASWENATPQGNIWQPVAGARLAIVLTWSPAWSALSDLQRANFRKKLKHAWGPSALDLGYAGLAASTPIRYASSAFGVERRTYERQP